MSNNIKRIIAGILGIPIILTASYFRAEVFLVFSLIVSSMAMWELFRMFRIKGYKAHLIPVMVCSAAIILFFENSEIMFYIFIFSSTLIFTLEIFRREDKSPLNSAVSIFGIIYITLPFVLLNLLVNRQGFNFVIYLFVLIWTCDTFAFYGGKLFGRNKLSLISPNKTIEGSVTGFIFTLVISMTIQFFYSRELRVTDAINIGLIVGIFSQAGDLFESLIKRYCGVKDSSEIIPGHGGILDRFDSIIFSAPLVYVYCIMIVK